jgi:hypothetical protein
MELQGAPVCVVDDEDRSHPGLVTREGCDHGRLRHLTLHVYTPVLWRQSYNHTPRLYRRTVDTNMQLQSHSTSIPPYCGYKQLQRNKVARAMTVTLTFDAAS